MLRLRRSRRRALPRQRATPMAPPQRGAGAARVALAPLGLLAALTAPALADAVEPATDLVARPLRPRGGQLWLGATLDLDLSHNRGGSRAFSPDVSYGVTDETSLSIAHSARSIARIGHPGGLCFEMCDFRPRYTVNVLAHHALLRRPSLQLYAQAGLLLRDTDPWKPASLTGLAARWQRGRFAVDAAPYLQLGLASTDEGNRHRVVAPLRLWLQPTCRWALGLSSGVEGELAVFADAYHVPFSGLVSTQLTSWLQLSAEVGLSSLGGPLNTASRRFGSITLETRL